MATRTVAPVENVAAGEARAASQGRKRMLRRIPELFAFVDVTHRVGTRLFEIPLQTYAAHGWYGGVYLGERPEAILRTQGTDTIAQCLAYTTMHLVQRVADSGVRGFGVLAMESGERSVSRLAGIFASLLVERVIAGIAADIEGVGFAQRDRDLERTCAGYRAVAQIMYPDSREMSSGIGKVIADSMESWQRAIEFALFLAPDALDDASIEPMLALVRTIGETLDSFYLYFLATSFGDSFYERYGI